MMPDDAVDRRELGEMKRDKISIQKLSQRLIPIQTLLCAH